MKFEGRFEVEPSSTAAFTNSSPSKAQVSFQTTLSRVPGSTVLTFLRYFLAAFAAFLFEYLCCAVSVLMFVAESSQGL